MNELLNLIFISFIIVITYYLIVDAVPVIVSKTLTGIRKDNDSKIVNIYMKLKDDEDDNESTEPQPPTPKEEPKAELNTNDLIAKLDKLENIFKNLDQTRKQEKEDR